MAIDVLGLGEPRHAGARRSARRERHAAPAEPARQNALPGAGRRQHDLRQRRDHRVPARGGGQRPPVAGARAGALQGADAGAARRRHHARRRSWSSTKAASAIPAPHSERWLAHQRGKITRALAAFEAAPPDPGKTDIVAIGLSLRARLSRLAQADGMAAGLSAASPPGSRPSPSMSRRSSARARQAPEGSRTMTPHSADTPADAPYWMASPSKPKLKLPPGACDAHVHVFGPREPLSVRRRDAATRPPTRRRKCCSRCMSCSASSIA